MTSQLTESERKELERLRALFKKRYAERGPRPESPEPLPDAAPAKKPPRKPRKKPGT